VRPGSPSCVRRPTPRPFALRSSVRLSELGELGLLAELERRGLAEQIEADAAEVEPGLVATQDSLFEGVHFRLDWLSWRELGFRTAAVNISDLAASGARPEALLVSLGLPGETELDDVLSLYAGIDEAGVPVRGGDTSEASLVSVTVTAIGRADRVPGRSGARPGDQLVVTGPLGGAGAAFREQRYVPPPLRVEEGIELARDAHAMLDLSDGLARDAEHIASRSGCQLVIELEQVPFAPGATHEDLGFGEDYELLAATPEPGRFQVIGRCEPGSGVEIRHDGSPVALSGWEHFRLR
jgi:thiamine-monophosphate kinase